jgi:diguanylate cyclase (GGDEF)-like protein/PAS domain S-box-containing protein
MKPQTGTTYFISAVIVVGVACLLFAGFNLDLTKVDYKFAILAIFTIAIGSRITVRIPRLKSHLAVSDTFIFLALLQYGGEAAVLLAATEAFFSSWRFCNKKITVLFNACIMAVSATAVLVALEVFSLYPPEIAHINSFNNLALIILITTLVYFVVNSGLTSFHGALKSSEPFWETWKTSYLWTSITYFAGGLSAAVLDYLIHEISFFILFASVPVIWIVFQTYKTYLKNVEISLLQAQQANEYASVLETQSIALRESEERFRSAFNYAPIGIALVSRTGEWLKVNNALRQLLGYDEEEFLSADFQSFIYPEDLGEVLVKFHLLLSGKAPTSQLEYRFLNKNSEIVWVHWSVSTTGNADSDNPNFIFQIQDITDRKKSEEALHYKATHDVLTGLPNRSLFMVRLNEAFGKYKTDSDYRVSVLFIDLDRFKIVNDSLGHQIGDALLIEIAARLKECLRPSDLVARLGGDEFTILVEGNFLDKEVLGIADRINKKFTLPFDLTGHEVYSSASIGILHASEKHANPDDLMRDADIAMYQAKRGGKSRYEVFDPNMHEEVKQVHELSNDLRRAIEKNELQVYYQPIVLLETGKITGFEALARWNHPKYGLIPATKFIHLAEESGLIGILGMNILEKACKQGKLWNENLSAENAVSISVNLSCKQFSNRNLVKHIFDVLDATEFDPKLLKFEITESVFLEHKERAIEMLHQLRNSGIEINIDDFGTGYSNLSCLTQMPISTLKIDRSFIDQLDQNGTNLEIAEIILKLAGVLNMSVIAEGIESEAQLNKLKKMGCQGGQGYFFGRPMEPDEAVKLIKPTYIKAFQPQLNRTVEMISTVQ